MRNTGVASQHSHFTRWSGIDEAALKSIAVEVSEEVLPPTEIDPNLDPAGSIVVEPDTYMLCAQLLLRGQASQDSNHCTETMN